MPIYIIKGNPVSLMRPRNLNLQYWDSLSKFKHEAIQELENQNKEQKIYTKPVHVDINFYFDQPHSPLKPYHPHGYNSSKPDITDLIKFVESITTGILLKDTNIIASISSCKKYSEAPRTEIVITEIENGKKSAE